MKIINKHTAKKYVRDNGYGRFHIAPSKVNVHHINDGWHLGLDFEMVSDRNKELHVLIKGGKSVPLQYFLDGFEVNNCNNELGRTTRFWENSTN